LTLDSRPVPYASFIYRMATLVAPSFRILFPRILPWRTSDGAVRSRNRYPA
jgi:hypothetical protein